MKGPEQRTVDVDVQDVETRGKTVVGYAAVYETEARIGGITETIARGAFAGVLDQDVRALLNHDANVVLGRTKSGTLRLFDEDRGLRFELDLPESRDDLREAIRRGDIDGASLGSSSVMSRGTVIAAQSPVSQSFTTSRSRPFPSTRRHRSSFVPAPIRPPARR